MKILGFDTSHGKCSVAIFDGANALAVTRSRESSMQAEMLMTLIEEALLRSCITYQDIDYLAVTTGPGSFTGIRIGLAAARGVLLATKIKPLALSNFDVSYFRISEQVKSFDYVVVIINAYRSQIYIKTYKNGGVDSAPQMIDLENFESYIKSLKGYVAIGGSGLEMIDYGSLMDENTTMLPRFPNPDARTICRLAYAKLNSEDIDGNLEPLYIRPPDAKLPSKNTF
ncbi:MAG: tRNA (adenosine(37)-N6)-threonylcarbamoyltransferase complex dimerization subunit type 1 TsaB [Pseudomonadota bacterium]